MKQTFDRKHHDTYSLEFYRAQLALHGLPSRACKKRARELLLEAIDARSTGLGAEEFDGLKEREKGLEKLHTKLFPPSKLGDEWELASGQPEPPPRYSISMGEASTHAKEGSATRVLSCMAQIKESSGNPDVYKPPSWAMQLLSERTYAGAIEVESSATIEGGDNAMASTDQVRPV